MFRKFFFIRKSFSVSILEYLCIGRLHAVIKEFSFHFQLIFLYESYFSYIALILGFNVISNYTSKYL